MTQAPGYSITIRMHVTPELHASGQIVAAVTEAGAVITGLDVSDPGTETTVVDLRPSHMTPTTPSHSGPRSTH